MQNTSTLLTPAYLMPTIRTLSQSMINKIAAGEVIERPASVVKELVENSIDAESTRIDITIENGGANLIRIVDNGCGISAEQLTLALSPHATSKLTDAEDLFRILSFGFRGEALASVAEISQLTLKSRIAESTTGAMIQSNGGKHSEITSCGMPSGTQIEVKNLFFNTPVRRRYMKSTTTEFGHIDETFTRLVLPQPDIHFTLKHNERIVHDLPPTDDPLARIRQLFGDEIARNLIAIESPATAAVRVTGFVSYPNHHRPNNRMQYFFLNRRFIRDRALQHALNEAYRGILVSGRFPLAFLQIELPPDMFDVNVHPTKMEVRFLDSNRIYTGFLGAIREKFLTSDLRSKLQTSAVPKEEPVNNPPPWETEEPKDALEPAAMEKKRQMVQDWITQISHQKEPGTVSPGVSLSIHHIPDREAADAVGCRPSGGNVRYSAPAYQSACADATVRRSVAYPDGASQSDRIAFSPEGHLVVQMLHRYLVMETEEGIALIDQHALHERILYEQMKERIQSGQLESQRLLVPVPVDLSPNEFSCVQENGGFFQTLGLQVEPFGGNTVLISALPAMLSKTSPLEILSAMVEPFLECGKKLTQEELLDKLLHSMACKAAVKAGEKLSAESMQHLIQLAEAERHSHHCPHGRPSMLVFTREEIDKMFERT